MDKLYGTKTSAAFKKACKAQRVEEVQIPDGVRVYVEWKNGSTMKIDCYPKRVHFLALTSEREGLYSDLCKTLPDLFKQRGVEHFTASAGNDEAEAILLKRGEWKKTGSTLDWSI